MLRVTKALGKCSEPPAPHARTETAAARYLQCYTKIMAAEERYCFFVEWFDGQADLIRRYQLTFYPTDQTCEMYDMKNRRSFLKRSETQVRLEDIYLGATVTIHARQLKVVEYADVYTRKSFEAKKSRTLAIVKPNAYNQLGKIIDTINTAGGVLIAKLKMVKLSKEDAEGFYKAKQGDPIFNELVNFITSDVVVVMELVGDTVIAKWRELCGPEDPEAARTQAPSSLRALYGADLVKNAVHASDSPQSAATELDFFFSATAKQWPTTALFNNCSCCVIRPHAMKQSGEIIDRILGEGFEISALQLWHIDKATAEEFLEVYKGVLPEYHDVVEQMCAGAAIVMEIRQEECVTSFRKLVGPADPEIAKHLRPQTLRAKFGVDRVKNAVHCTDLPEDGLLEVEYFFNILFGRSS